MVGIEGNPATGDAVSAAGESRADNALSLPAQVECVAAQSVLAVAHSQRLVFFADADRFQN